MQHSAARLRTICRPAHTEQRKINKYSSPDISVCTTDLQVDMAIRVTKRIVYEEFERNLRGLHLQQQHKATAHIVILKRSSQLCDVTRGRKLGQWL